MSSLEDLVLRRAGAELAGDLLVVFREPADKRHATVEIRRALGDLPVSKDIVVTTVGEIAQRGHLIGGVLLPALLDGEVLYEQR